MLAILSPIYNCLVNLRNFVDCRLVHCILVRLSFNTLYVNIICNELRLQGFDPNTKLRQICLYTLDKNLRDYLASELETQGALTQEEVDMLRFVHQLEELYPCASYDVSKSVHAQSQQRFFFYHFHFFFFQRLSEYITVYHRKSDE